MLIQKPLVDMIEDVVKATETAILPYLQSIDPLIQHIHYEHGHPKEIVATLAKMKTADQQFKKYPLIALFQDITETVGGLRGLYGSAPLNLIITTSTNENYTANERYEKKFIPILLPIYDEFMRQLKKSRYFQFADPKQAQHKKSDRVFWGKKGLYGVEGNVFDDRLDAVEVEGLTVLIKKTECVNNSLYQINH